MDDQLPYFSFVDDLLQVEVHLVPVQVLQRHQPQSHYLHQQDQPRYRRHVLEEALEHTCEQL